MSTRVEKGGPKFKPVLKSKSRPPPPPTTSAAPNDFCWLRPSPSVGPAQSDISQITSTQGTSTETAQPHEVSPSAKPITNNVSRRPATPILISNSRTRSSVMHVTPTPSSRNQITPVTISGSPSSPHTVTKTSEPAVTPQPSNDTQQESGKRSTVSQKQPKKALFDTEEQAKKNRRSKRATKTMTEETQNDGTDTLLQKTGELAEEPQVSPNSSLKRKRAESAQREGSTRLDGEGQSSGEATVKRRRRRKTIVEVPEGPIDPIDPTQITMRAICDDPGSGRKSSRWETSQVLHAEARKNAKEERARLVIEAEQRERDSGRSSSKRAPFQPTLPSTGASSERGEERTDEFSYDESLKASHYAPQVRIGANGEIVLDVDSLQVDRAADPDIVEEYSHIEENDHSRFTNSNSWSKRRLVRWGKEDTALFYAALRQFGQNFDLIARVLPGKTYRMCKNKFKAEDKKNPTLIDEALRNVVAVDLNVLSQMTGKDFTGPTPTITAKPALSLADADDSTIVQQQDDNMNGIENLEGGDTDERQHEQEQRGVTETQIAQATFPPESTFTTVRQSESPPPADTLLERSPSIPTKVAEFDTLKNKGKPNRQPILVGAPKRAISILPTRLSVKR
ncbi:hypothetical protein Clacol_003926 [Clathrus columnatus]|uniref:Myb-like domain-containing protein n=1 Tax=Clathrus columnatus TaxID=1419009 RepID=A0AAV5A877_9AGAM|nr:hypothetical protein Clacol_003926 [Clathrus columnatus]